MLRLKTAKRRNIPNALAILGALLLMAGALPGLAPETVSATAGSGDATGAAWLAEAPAEAAIAPREVPSQTAIKRSKRLRVHLFLLPR